jgi:hypothetical protein
MVCELYDDENALAVKGKTATTKKMNGGLGFHDLYLTGFY